MWPSHALATVMAAVVVAAAPVAAQAHGEGWLAGAGIHGALHTGIETPAVPGLRIEVLDGRVPALFVRNTTGRKLVVRDAHGAPFLKIGPRGVHADTGSGAYMRSAGSAVRPAAPPRWTVLSRQSQWAWLEHRAQIRGEGGVPDFGTRPRTVHRWTTTMTLADRQLRVRGHVRWIPTGFRATHVPDRPAGHTRFWLAAVALKLATIVASATTARE